MSWAGIAGNQTVTFNNLQDAVNTGVFTLKNSIPASQECITKSDADYYVYINTSNAGYASKASNQLVYKADLTAPASGVSFEVTSGLYPLSGSSSTTVVGNIINNTSGYLYMSWKFNSAGVSSGTLNAGQDIYTSGLASGQLIGSWSGFGSEIIQSMFTVNPNSSRAITITKNDGYGSGSYIRIGYATVPNGTITWL